MVALGLFITKLVVFLNFPEVNSVENVNKSVKQRSHAAPFFRSILNHCD